jgi:nitroimidazol reductase NimA-like FMN-containing flavoprotein (pyridoxamine 5'-phosphate oxidase superfamily)
MPSELVGVAGFEPAASSSRSQVQTWTASTAARMTWDRPSVTVRWRPLLSVAMLLTWLLGPSPAVPCNRLTGRLGFGAMPDDKADLSSPSDSASPAPGASARRVLERLSDAECMELLANGGVGRLVYNSRYGPAALPVVYKIDAGSVVLGTWDPVLFDEDLRTGIAHAEYQVAVEADQLDLEAREGWFVLIRGAAHHLDTEAERAPLIDAGLEPWIEEVPAHFIRVNPTSTWGNRVLRA